MLPETSSTPSTSHVDSGAANRGARTYRDSDSASLTLAHSIKAHALELGFDLVGVTTPASSNHADFYARWLEAGYHAGMAYLARPDAVCKRLQPARVMASARSILVVGMNYYTHDEPCLDSLRGRVARFAWGTDYHAVLLGRLRALAIWIEETVDHPVACRAYVDTGPVLERELARRAGLGWIGKNTCLIHPWIGSFLFLGVLFLDLELSPDPPFDHDYCGKCHACIDACPTGALVSPRNMDARRCIAYLSIEHRGTIPREYRPAMGSSVFGCDICQSVCPWNLKHAGPSEEPAFYARAGQSDPCLPELLQLDKAGFRAKFRGTPVWRARRAGLARNAAVALGNLRDRKAIPALTRALSDPDRGVVEHVQWALSRIPPGE